MKTIMARNPHDSFSFSRRYFHWKNKFLDEQDDDDVIMHETLTFTTTSSSSSSSDDKKPAKSSEDPVTNNFPPTMLQHSLSVGGGGQAKPPARKKLSVIALSRQLRSALALGRARTRGPTPLHLGSKVVGTLFGHRRGHVRFAFQEDFKAAPAFLVELATPTSVLVKEMASGLVRIALECDKINKIEKKGLVVAATRILDEPVWRTYCNGKKCGYALRRECGPDEWKVLNAVGPISMGAGVLPGSEPDGEMMYMRAKFERVVGSKDSEAFYMMNPDGNGGPELSIYLLRV